MVFLEVVHMAINFKKFCMNHTNNVKLVIPSIVDEVPDVYKNTAERVLKDLKTRVGMFDRTPIPYIQDTIDMVDDMDKALSPTNGDVPDSLIEHISTELYNNSFNNVDVTEQSIIVIVALYICVAKNSKSD